MLEGSAFSQSESVVLCISDTHLGKKTETYGADVFHTRMNALKGKLRDMRDWLPSCPDELIIMVSGDMIDGDGIFPSQSHEQEISDPRRQSLMWAEFMAEWLKDVKAIWGNVRVEGVCGNHGRSNPSSAVSNNYDLITLDLIGAYLKGCIPVNYNSYGQGDPFVRKIQIRGHSYLLYHGDTIRMFQGIPFYGITQRNLRWNSSALGPIDVSICGHFHVAASWPINSIRALCTGTIVTNDPWSLRVLGMESPSAWWIFGVSDEEPITWQIQMDLAA